MSSDHLNDEEREIERFDARFFGDMSAADRAVFDRELGQDPAMAQRYGRYMKAVGAVIQGHDTAQGKREELRAQLHEIDRELDERPSFRWWWAAAAVVIATGVIWLLVPRGTDLLAEFALPEPGLPVLMSSASDQRMERIMNSYKLERYQEAATLLEAALIEEPGNDTLHYFAGVVAQRLHGCPFAIEHYRSVKETRFAARARYQIMLCQLQAGDTLAARQQLEALTSAGDVQVRELSRRLRERL